MRRMGAVFAVRDVEGRERTKVAVAEKMVKERGRSFSRSGARRVEDDESRERRLRRKEEKRKEEEDEKKKKEEGGQKQAEVEKKKKEEEERRKKEDKKLEKGCKKEKGRGRRR